VTRNSEGFLAGEWHEEPGHVTGCSPAARTISSPENLGRRNVKVVCKFVEFVG